MQFSKITVALDNGDRFEVLPASRDLLKLERDGVDLEHVPSIEATYRVVHAVLLRLERTGAISPSEPIPESWEGLADVADVDSDESNGDQGEASGQEATTGS